MMNKLERWVSHIGVIAVVGLFILITVQVVLRYGFGYTHFLTEEFGRYLLVWGTLAGMAIEARRGGHIRVAFLADRLPAGFRRLWLTFLDLVILMLFLILVYTGIGSTVFNHGQESTGLQLPLSLPFAAIPIFFALAAIFMIERLRRRKDQDS